MNWLQDKRGFVDTEVIMSPGFVILAAIAVGATLLGWVGGKKMGFEASFPAWQIIIFIFFELIACYVITVKMLN